jgi:hypothetical protein
VKYIIFPKKGAGIIPLKCTRTEIEGMLGKPPDVFSRTPDGPTILAYDNVGMHITLSSNETVETISIFRPNEAFLNEVQVLSKDIDVLNDELSLRGLNFIRVDAGLWSEGMNILLIDVDGMVDGVEIGP